MVDQTALGSLGSPGSQPIIQGLDTMGYVTESEVTPYVLHSTMHTANHAIAHRPGDPRGQPDIQDFSSGQSLQQLMEMLVPPAPDAPNHNTESSPQPSTTLTLTRTNSRRSSSQKSYEKKYHGGIRASEQSLAETVKWALQGVPHLSPSAQFVLLRDLPRAKELIERFTKRDTIDTASKLIRDLMTLLLTEDIVAGGERDGQASRVNAGQFEHE